MKLKIFIAVLVVIIAAFIVYSQTTRKAFAPAEDFPRDAIVYVQIADLPALINLWNGSQFKKKYLETRNFKDFANNHLGRKLASRWQEFSDAAGFPIDLNVVSRLAGNQASIALYDVGKLEFVFIAPVSDEIFAATKFAQSREKFTEETLDDDTIIYRAAVEADRGRQKQELIFTQLKGRFILATSEKLLAQTIANINGKKTKNRLLDEPSFKLLSEKIEPHTAIVWLDQAALNDDYYFKRYWLMSDVKDLNNIRAGIFDFEMREGKFIEHRKFLLDKAVESAPVGDSEAARILSYLPPDIPFYRVESADAKKINEAIEKTIFARRKTGEKKTGNNFSSYSSADDDDYSNSDYASPGEKFDQAIDESDDVETVEKSEPEIDFSKILQPFKPQMILTFTQPALSNAPLFAEFRQATIFDLAAQESFRADDFESAIIQKLAAQTMINAPGATLKWETRTGNDFTRRELNLPMLNQNIAYTTRGGFLILTNDPDFLREILTRQNPPETEKQNSPFDSLTVINFEEKENAYDNVFAELTRQKLAEDFFAENIQSLLDAASKIRKIEIRNLYSPIFLDEEIIVSFD